MFVDRLVPGMTPLATRCATAVPLIGLDIDASEKTVSGVIASVLPTSRTPKPLLNSTTSS